MAPVDIKECKTPPGDGVRKVLLAGFKQLARKFGASLQRGLPDLQNQLL